MRAFACALVAIAFFVAAVGARAQVPAPPPCAAETPPALTVAGVPARAIPGRAYTVALEPNPAAVGPAVDRLGATIGVTDSTGRGWSAKYQYVRGLQQAFSVGLDAAPFTLTVAYVEQGGDDATCTRTISASLPVLRRILAVVGCRRGVVEPAFGIVLTCRDSALRLRGMRWRGWNADTATGRGMLVTKAGRVYDATVTMSTARECATLDGFIYTRVKVRTERRTYRIPIACPIIA
jgi:hypothetical protein